MLPIVSFNHLQYKIIIILACTPKEKEDHCNNNGECLVIDDKPICTECYEGHTGPNCNSTGWIKIKQKNNLADIADCDEKQMKEQCNNNGICKIVEGKPKCVECYPGYELPDCKEYS